MLTASTLPDAIAVAAASGTAPAEGDVERRVAGARDDV